MPFMKLSTHTLSGEFRTVFVEIGSVQRVDFWTKEVPNKHDPEPRATVWVYGAESFEVSNPVQVVALRILCEKQTEDVGRPNHFDGGRTIEGSLNPRDQDSDD